MIDRDSTKRFTIGEVVAQVQQTHPDVSHSSLRFLEREGLLRATRTQGGHRLYGPADVERILQIKTWQSERLSLDAIRQRLEQRDRLPNAVNLVESFLDRATTGDLPSARRIVLEADEIGLSLGQSFDTILLPVLGEVGRRWERGDLLVAQEKEISELARDLIATLSARHADPAPQGPVVVAACVEGEDHDLGLRMVCGLLRERGIRLYLLGADVAPRFLLESARLHAPSLILLSAHLDPRLPALLAAIRAVRSDLPPEIRPAIAAGGGVVLRHPADVHAAGAVAITNDQLRDAVNAVLGLLPSSLDDEASA